MILSGTLVEDSGVQSGQSSSLEATPGLPRLLELHGILWTLAKAQEGPQVVLDVPLAFRQWYNAMVLQVPTASNQPGSADDRLHVSVFSPQPTVDHDGKETWSHFV